MQDVIRINRRLAIEVEHEILEGPKTKETLLTNRKGTIKFFVRLYELQKTFSQHEEDLLNQMTEEEELANGIKYTTLKTIATLVKQAILRRQEPFEHGYMYVNYQADEEGAKLEKLNIAFENEVHHRRY